MLQGFEFLSLDGPFVHEGPYLSYDDCGYEVALAMLWKFTRKGSDGREYQQVETI